jgi:hypothetical protein
MAYGEPFVGSCEAEVDYNGSIILGLPNDVFKTVIFPKMCKGMDNAAPLNSLCGWRLVSKGWNKMLFINVVWPILYISISLAQWGGHNA